MCVYISAVVNMLKVIATAVVLAVFGTYSLEFLDIEFIDCPYEPRDTLIYSPNTSATLGSCVLICVNRPWCEAALFHRQYSVCHAVLQGDMLLDPSRTHSQENGTSCILFNKSYIANELHTVWF